LVVETARDTRELLALYLKDSGYRASVADGAEAARRLMQTSSVDLVILDTIMPGEAGFSLCRSIKENFDIPVIMLTGRGDEVDAIVSLEVGADDYVTKPFNPRELLARIDAVLRRFNTLPPRLRGSKAKRYCFGDWIFNAAQREIVGQEGFAMSLANGEFKLLTAFLERPNVVLSREQLLSMTKGRNTNVFERSIDNQVKRLRRKIERDPKNHRYIKTVWGSGYVFAAEVKIL
jgi:two-component system OmpR family response regulator